MTTNRARKGTPVLAAFKARFGDDLSLVAHLQMNASFPALDEVTGKLKAKRQELGEIFAEAGPDLDLSKVKRIDGDSAAKADHIRKLNEEMTDLGKQRDGLKAVADAAQAVRDGEAEGENEETEPPARTKRVKSFGEQFIASQAYKAKGSTAELDVELKTLMDSATGWVPEQTRGPRVVDFATRPIELLDLIPTTTTVQTAVTFMEETTFTNNAAETAEAGTKPEAALALTERSSLVRKIAVWIPVTDEQLEDVDRIAQYLDNRLPFMIRQRLAAQIIAGNGTAPNLRGFLNVSGIQTQAKGADPTPDAVYKALVKVMVTGEANPNAAIFHPLDWQNVRLLRTADGIYIWGNPSDAGPERIWGLAVTLAQAATVGTALVLDTSYTELAIKKGIEVETSNSHGTFFIENKQAVRAEMRAALVVYRPAAICAVTGL